MAWPTTTISTTHMDAAGDDPSQARAEIKQMADNVNDIKNSKGVANGLAELDAGGLLPIAQLPVVTAAKGGSGQSTYTIGDILIATGATTLSKLAASTLGYVLTSNGPGVAPSWQLAGGGLTSGVRMLFQQTTAPTGWTKETNSAFNNVALRIVTGSVSSGGADDFNSVFGVSKSTDAHTLTTAQIPAHTHPILNLASGGIGNDKIAGANTALANDVNTQSTGGGGSHSHALVLDLKYRDFIIAQKD
jgi:microcystin-dependent protein